MIEITLIEFMNVCLDYKIKFQDFLLTLTNLCLFMVYLSFVLQVYCNKTSMLKIMMFFI